MRGAARFDLRAEVGGCLAKACEINEGRQLAAEGGQVLRTLLGPAREGKFDACAERHFARHLGTGGITGWFDRVAAGRLSLGRMEKIPSLSGFRHRDRRGRLRGASWSMRRRGQGPYRQSGHQVRERPIETSEGAFNRDTVRVHGSRMRGELRRVFAQARQSTGLLQQQWG